MAALNDAADRALRSIADGTPPTSGSHERATADPSATARSADQAPVGRMATDIPSFTVEALPVETFEALLVVASWIGEVELLVVPGLLQTEEYARAVLGVHGLGVA
jgi:hypothetical protein